jgi:hypothetical protein
MPELDKDFIEHSAKLIEKLRPDLIPVDVEKLWQAFRQFGSRPQFFANALGDVLNPLNDVPGRFEDYVLDAALRRQADDEAQMESAYLALKPIEQAVIWRLLELGSNYRPYDAEAKRFYAERIREKVSAQQAQAALESLRSQTPALIWKSARGEYALDEAMMHVWYKKRMAAGTWPPTDAEDGQGAS